jgi:hypothetical protein
MPRANVAVARSRSDTSRYPGGHAHLVDCGTTVGDQVLFYYSGHGFYTPDTNYDEDATGSTKRWSRLMLGMQAGRCARW